MRVTRAIAVAGLWCSVLLGCTATRPDAAVTYVVRPDDTLYGIAWRHNLDYRELARWNHIGSDYRLTVGQVLVLKPDAVATGVRSEARPSPAPHAPPSTPPNAPRSMLPSPVKPPPAPIVAPVDAVASRLAWVWPTARTSAPVPVAGGGILLLGTLGQEVRAASAGRVVYTGSGIRGYGNLIIIKHGDTVLSSYAHNRDIAVHEGQDVLGGQTIGHMGTGAHGTSALYFEIRVNGKPVDPLRYLPATH